MSIAQPFPRTRNKPPGLHKHLEAQKSETSRGAKNANISRRPKNSVKNVKLLEMIFCTKLGKRLEEKLSKIGDVSKLQKWIIL